MPVLLKDVLSGPPASSLLLAFFFFFLSLGPERLLTMVT